MAIEVRDTYDPLEVIEVVGLRADDDDCLMHIVCAGGQVGTMVVEAGWALANGCVSVVGDEIPTGMLIPGSLFGQDENRSWPEAIAEPTLIVAARRLIDRQNNKDAGDPFVPVGTRDALIELFSERNGWPVPWWLRHDVCPAGYHHARQIVEAGDAIISKGGPGSGNFGHAGRPGEVGGSAEGQSAGPVARSIRSTVEAGLALGKSPQEIIDYVKAKYPNSKINPKHITWYKSNMKKATAASSHPASSTPSTPAPVAAAGAIGAAHAAISKAGVDVTKLQQAYGQTALPAHLETRTRATAALLKSPESCVADAVTHLDAGAEERTSLLTKLTTGHSGALAKAKLEYAQTPVCDLEVLKGISIRDTPVSGQAVCYHDRRVEMGSTSVTGDYRHELGHALRFALSGAGGPSAKTDVTEFVAARYKDAAARAQAKPDGIDTKLSHDWYETNYGIIGRRGLDNWEENFAEHYRGYHKAIYQARSGEDTQALSRYKQRFPEWTRFWDAHYTVALVGTQKGA